MFLVDSKKTNIPLPNAGGFLVSACTALHRQRNVYSPNKAGFGLHPRQKNKDMVDLTSKMMCLGQAPTKV